MGKQERAVVLARGYEVLGVVGVPVRVDASMALSAVKYARGCLDDLEARLLEMYEAVPLTEGPDEEIGLEGVRRAIALFKSQSADVAHHADQAVAGVALYNALVRALDSFVKYEKENAPAPAVGADSI